MKLYCFYTASYEIFLKTWFLSSNQDDFDVVLHKSSFQGEAANYKEEDWYNITKEKAKYIIQTIQENMGDTFIFSDVDIQFFQQTKPYIDQLMGSKDLLIQRDDPQGMCCTGFLVLRGNRKTLRLWQDIYNLIGNEFGDDQDCFNMLLRPPTILFRMLNKVLSSNMKIKLSTRRANKYHLKWEYLPNTFFSGGTLTGNRWVPAENLSIPENIILHHANWTVGMDNKIAQLKYVRDIVQSREAD